MKTRFLYYILFCIASVFSACEKRDFADGVLSPITSIEDVRALYKGEDVTIARQGLMEAHQITGVVISDVANGNAPAGMLVVQNTWRKRTRGITIPLETASNYQSGDSLIIEIEGATLKKVNGGLQIAGLSDASIQKVSSGNTTNVQSVSSINLNAKPDEYESTLVQVRSGVISPEPAFGDPFTGEKIIENGAEKVILHTEPNSSFASEPIPASASFAGICVVTQPDSDVPFIQIWPRSIADVSDIVGPADPNADLGENAVIITGFVNDVKGGDGNYEYFQFMATEDIDFTKTPMAVLTCTNGGSATPYAGTAAAGGWATGGGRTYKFNLISGSVSKGEFFYVGGSNKKINGPNTTDISAANWVRSIAYVTNDGDGIGLKSGGLLPNSGNAGGIAIFEGINITETSVPMDAVFYGGTGKATIFDAVNNFGYRVPANDHYNPVEPATSAEQPFFYQGTNQYVIPHGLDNAGIFVKLGGVFNVTSNTWTTPRSYVHYLMSSTTELSEVETGADITAITN